MLVDQWDLRAAEGSASQLVLDTATNTLRWTAKHGDRLEFDPATGLLRQRVDRNGNRTEYRYVDANRDGRTEELERIVRQGGLTTWLFYTAAGLLNWIVDEVGRVTRWSIVDGQVHTVTFPSPGYGRTRPIWTFTYAGSDGLLASVTDPCGKQASIQHGAGTRRVEKVVNPDGKSWTLRPYLLDGIQGQWRIAPTGRIGARDADGSGRYEPRPCGSIRAVDGGPIRPIRLGC